MADGRVQVNDSYGVPAPQYNTPATPVDTYVRPDTSGVDGLARALSTLNPALTSYVDQEMERRKADATAAAQGKLGGMTWAEAQQAVKDGKITEFQDPFFKAAFMKQYGQRAFSARQMEMQSAYENFDKSKGDIEQFIADRTKADIESFNGDKHAIAGYMQYMTPQANAIRQDVGKYRADQARAEVKDGALNDFMLAGDKAIAAGKSDAEVASVLRAKYEPNNQVLKLSFADQDALMFEVAKRYADQGRVGLVKELLTQPRDGIPPISSKTAYATKVQELINHAEAQSHDKAVTDGYNDIAKFHADASAGVLDEEKLKAVTAKGGLITPSMAAGLIATNAEAKRVAAEKAQRVAVDQQAVFAADTEEKRLRAVDLANAKGGAFRVSDPSVKLHTKEDIKSGHDPSRDVSMLDRAKWVDEDYRRESGQQYDADIKNKVDPNVAASNKFERDVKFYSNSGVVNEQWKQVLDNGYAVASVGNITGKNPTLDSALALYTSLYDRDPQLVTRMTSDKNAIAFYEAYRVARMAGQDDQQSRLAALDYIKDPSKFNYSFDTLQREDIDRAINGFDGNWKMIGGSGAIGNKAEVGAALQQLAQFYMTVGKQAPKKALEMAVEKFKQTHISVNGWMIPNPVGSPVVPGDLKVLLEGRVADYYEKYGKAMGISKSDLTVRPLGNDFGKWAIIFKTGLAVPMPNGQDARSFTITLDDLSKDQKRLEDAKRHQVVTDQNTVNDNMKTWTDDLEHRRNKVLGLPDTTPTKP